MRWRRRAGGIGEAFGLWWFGYAVLAILAATAVTLGVIAFTVQSSYAKAAQVDAAKYTPPVPTGSTEPIIDAIGDSYTAGSAMDSGPSKLWVDLLTFRDGWGISNMGVGGSGYLTKGPASTTASTFVQRASKVDPDADVILFFGSRNDGNANPQQLTAAANAAFSAAHKRAPNAKIVVIGPVWVDSTRPAGIVSDSAAIKQAAEANHATWVDPLAANWFPTGSGLIGSDGIHPTDAGHAHLANLIEPIIRAALQ